MKKVILLSALALAYYYGAAQSFTFVNPVSNYSNSNVSQTLQAFVTIHNGSSTAKDVKVRRTQNILASGHTNYFCWFLCYDDTINLSSASITVQPGTDNFDFSTDVDPHGAAGIDTVCFRFFDVNNASDNADICLYFDIGTGIPTVITPQQNALSVASPNPANNWSEVSYYADVTKNPKLMVCDLLGGKIFETNLLQKQGVYILNVADFKQGIYLYSLIENGKTVATKKLVVAHK